MLSLIQLNFHTKSVHSNVIDVSSPHLVKKPLFSDATIVIEILLTLNVSIIISTVCLKVRICVKCLVTYGYDKKKPHTCGIKYCRICRTDKPVRHECFIPSVAPKKHKFNRELFIFFDLECTQSKPFTDDAAKFAHTPNLCVSHQVCATCEIITDMNLPFENCGIREMIFFGNNVITHFMEYLGSISDTFKSITIIAHNLQKYDGHFLLQYMYENTSDWCLKEDSLVMNGTKNTN